MSPESRYCVGIDLGTTNSALAYFDLLKPSQPIHQFKIAQLGNHGHEELLPFLPSFIYLDGEKFIVGTWGKIQGALIPTRLVQSAKSWLTHGAGHREEKILPFDAPEKFRSLSPVEASALYLSHLKAAWDRFIAKGDPTLFLEEQMIILTVPASFDEVARRLTVKAAAKAGLKHVILLEEPQAAFYNWLMEKSSEEFKPGELILICDVGGGTTDFSLIEAQRGKEGMDLRRMAVGKHLLLGGDNMDAALCHYLEKKIEQELDETQHLSLLQQARLAKETLLSHPQQKIYTLSISGKGSQVVGGSIALEIRREEVDKLLLEGFFGLYDFQEAILLNRGSGIRNMGLPFESEPSVTKQLAYFLYKNGYQRRPDYLLFNGGAFKPLPFQQRILDSLHKWFPEGKQIQVLPPGSLDLAVARGAAYFAKLRMQGEPLLSGGIPRSYYLGLDKTTAITLVPRGMGEGERITSPRKFFLTPNQEVSFELYHSHTRIKDQTGDIVTLQEEDFTKLPPLYTRCTYGKKGVQDQIPVLLEIYLTPIGTLELELISQISEHRWKLEFLLRSHDETETGPFSLQRETIDAHTLTLAQKEVEQAFAMGSQALLNSLMGKLEKLLEMKRNDWPPNLLRGLFDTVLQQAYKRLLSTDYEARFWNLAGFFLRPGMGYPLDEHRMKQLWKLILADLKKGKTDEVLLQQWICLRRVAAGLSKGAQNQLFNEIGAAKIKKKGSYLYAENIRALAALELVDTSAKVKLGNVLLRRIVEGEGAPCDFWALGRLGARHLFHGTAANVIASGICEEWVTTLLNAPHAQGEHLAFTLAMLARKTDQRSLNLSQQLLEQIAPLLPQQDLLLQEHVFTVQEQERFFGDSLPPGLRLER
jgi:hypothetical protein